LIGLDTAAIRFGKGVVYVGVGGNVCALDASTGAKLWSYTTGGEVNSSPAMANGVVYIGSDDNNVNAPDASTGAKLWSYHRALRVFSTLGCEWGGLCRVS